MKLVKMYGGRSILNGKPILEGYRVVNSDGTDKYLLLKESRGGHTKYYRNPNDGNWHTSTYFSWRPTLKAWKEYLEIT